MTRLTQHRFWDTIMATQFVVIVEAPENETARVRAVAEDVFHEIRRLESLLSRFIEDSDISQINRLRIGESTIISPETHRCLELALEARRISAGYFDIAYQYDPGIGTAAWNERLAGSTGTRR